MTNQSKNKGKTEKQEPIDAIRRMNPGSHIPSGAELAERISEKDMEPLKPVTGAMINKHAHFLDRLAQEIFKQLSEGSLNNVKHVIGVKGEASWIVYSTAKGINKYRLDKCQEKESQMSILPSSKACTAIYAETRKHEFSLLSRGVNEETVERETYVHDWQR